MEVHAHTHIPTSREKKWTHYFWEFLMLFLAVFCGFLAEYQLEHVIENQREKKYAVSLLEDLINDTADLNRDIPLWQLRADKADSLRKEIIKPPSERNNIRVYRWAADLNYNNTFLYHDRTIGQLKYSGNFRLIRKKSVADSLVEYDAVIVTTLKEIESIHDNIITPARLLLQDQLFSSKFYEIRNDPVLFDSAVKHEPGIIMIKKGKEDVLFQYYNKVYTYRGHQLARIRFQKILQRRATNLILLIKKEYNLK
jgi:hypothetical protein